jgi:hypothetical protein
VPDDSWPFLEKVRHSAFYATPLDYLLTQKQTKRVILTGQVTEQRILYSALDAYIRHFDVTVPSDAIAHIDPDLGAAALRMMERRLSNTHQPRHHACCRDDADSPPGHGRRPRASEYCAAARTPCHRRLGNATWCDAAPVTHAGNVPDYHLTWAKRMTVSTPTGRLRNPRTAVVCTRSPTRAIDRA